jgi:hypothetical protein
LLICPIGLSVFSVAVKPNIILATAERNTRRRFWPNHFSAFLRTTSSGCSMTASNIATDNNDDIAAQNSITLELAKKEMGEHMEGMVELYKTLRSRSLIVKAFTMEDLLAPSETNTDVKIVHFVRHGQGQWIKKAKAGLEQLDGP